MAHLEPDVYKIQEKYSIDSDRYGSLWARPLTEFIRLAVKNSNNPIKNNTVPAAAISANTSK